MTGLEQQIIDTTEVRRHNGQCEHGDWIDLGSEDIPGNVRSAIADEIAEAMGRDMRHEPSLGNTDDRGMVEIGGQAWVYRR